MWTIWHTYFSDTWFREMLVACAGLLATMSTSCAGSGTRHTPAFGCRSCSVVGWQMALSSFNRSWSIPNVATTSSATNKTSMYVVPKRICRQSVAEFIRVRPSSEEQRQFTLSNAHYGT
jgi:hypothetical protein